MKNIISKINAYLEQPLVSTERMNSICGYLESPLLSEGTQAKLTTVLNKAKPEKLISKVSGVKIGNPVKAIKEHNPVAKVKGKISQTIDTEYTALEISPSKITSNQNVKWMIAEFARLFYPHGSIWWEVHLTKDSIKFYLMIPKDENTTVTVKRQLLKTWKQSTIREVGDPMKPLDVENTDITTLSLDLHPILALNTDDPTYSPLDSLLNAKYYLKEGDVAILQIGLQPLGEGWNTVSQRLYEEIKQTGAVPRKPGKGISLGSVGKGVGIGIGLVSEELMNLLGGFVIPGWVDNTELQESLKKAYGESDNKSTRNKLRVEAFKTSIRIIAVAEDDNRRLSIMRALSSGFDPLAGDNKLVESLTSYRSLEKMITMVSKRRLSAHCPDVLGSLELAKIIQVPDRKAQIEHYNELEIETTRGETEVPTSIFNEDGGIPFAVYKDPEGMFKKVYFGAKDINLFCMPRIYIGEPGTGKTTAAVSFSIDAFLRGFGVFAIDAADGKMIARILSMVPPELKHKVKIIDFLNKKSPIGIGWNEAFRCDQDSIEDLLVEEVIAYIQLVSEVELNMRAKQWVENAVKAVFVTPDATLQDVESMLRDAAFRAKIIPTIEDPQLRSDWENFHDRYTPADRVAIYNEAFRRLGPVIRKKSLKTFILQRPKKDKDGNYLFDIRKWMDEGYLVLVKANESLGETIQTALVSFLIAKFNLAIISREEISNEDDRPPCFLVLDEPDHYIKGSERWRRMLTRYRKYRCGLLFLFHGWQQLSETDRNLPKIIRKAGPHYIIYHTDLDNMIELKSVIEPEFKINDLVKGMPQRHAVIKLNMFSDKGEPVPSFMAKSLDWPEDTHEVYDNTDLYDLCAEEMGRPKKEVLDEIFRSMNSGDYDEDVDMTTVSTEGEVDIDEEMPKVKSKEDLEEEEDKLEKDRKARLIMEHEISCFIEAQIDRGEEPDIELIEHMDELLEEG